MIEKIIVLLIIFLCHIEKLFLNVVYNFEKELLKLMM